MIPKKYLFDSDSLIAAKNFYYSPDFCPAFWDWILQGNQHSFFFTIDRIADEFKCGDKTDYLHKFVESHYDLFVLETKNDHNCILKYSEIQKWASSVWANGKNPSKVAKALEVFANEKMADPWLVAYASINKYTIISNESSAPESQTVVKLPDVASAFGVEVKKLHDVLRIHSGHNFSFKVI